jgi:serine/threonine-protein kinase
LRALPDTARAVCVYCGSPLVPAARNRSAQARAPDPRVGSTIDGRFHIEDLVGQGGMGEVYRARHLALDRTVVLKMLKRSLLEDPTLVGRFEREAKAASRLNHPNVIQVLDFGRAAPDGTLYIVMEHVDGKDLRVVLRDEWPLAEERLCGIMAQVCAALAEAHSNNVIHRDLKPENIMVQERRDQPDFVKVLDFGIAKILDHELPAPVRLLSERSSEPDGPGPLTRHDVVCGTPQYMAPEQATGAHLDARSDLYAVGVILYQMATGRLPFDGSSSMEVLTQHVNEPPVPPRDLQPDAPISQAMEELILRALEKDPARRPQNAEQFRDELLAVPAKARARRTAVPEPERRGAPAVRPVVPLVAGIALAVVALAAIAAQLLH